MVDKVIKNNENRERDEQSKHTLCFIIVDYIDSKLSAKNKANKKAKLCELMAWLIVNESKRAKELAGSRHQVLCVCVSSHCLVINGALYSVGRNFSVEKSFFSSEQKNGKH